ncbi:MAG TPA: transcription elongation factor GreB [Thiobacillaceae bacterium]|nr:transcription elongation factor GreB [Thiobacillaceae bacterium]
MNKAFVRDESPETEDEEEVGTPLPPGGRNYITRSGYARLNAELNHLVRVERPQVVNTVAWAAGNGDRSENGDYIYGKKRLREIDRRIRFLTRRIDAAEVVDPGRREATDKVYFGATVTVIDEDGVESDYSIVGVDEADPGRGRISWVSPLARALLKAGEGDTVRFQSPGGARELEIVAVRYLDID